MRYSISKYASSIFVASFLFVLTTELVLSAENEFPGRNHFLKVPYISITELKKNLHDVIVIDVRSKYEYDTLKIKGAFNIPLASKSFVADMKKLRNRYSKKIVVSVMVRLV